MPASTHDVGHGHQVEALLIESLQDLLKTFRLDQCNNVLHFALSSPDGLADDGIGGLAVLGKVETDVLLMLGDAEANELVNHLQKNPGHGE